MKTSALILREGRQLAIAVGVFMLATATLARAADGGPTSSDPFIQKMKQWQDDMSQLFHNTWLGLGQDKNAANPGQSTVATASVDLREQQDGYTVRLNLPSRDLTKVEINLTGNTLHIVAPADGKVGRYEQNIQLDGVAPKSAPQIERKQNDNLIVINVPKAPDVADTKPAALPAAPLAGWDAWDRDVLEQMDRMQRDMDSIFNQAFAEYHNQPGFGGVFNQARFDSSFEVQEEGNKYVVRAYLPARDMNNVNVSIEGQILKIEAKSEDTPSGANSAQNEKDGAIVSRKALYSQLLTLPGPVQADKMTVDRKENMLVVTLPKA